MLLPSTGSDERAVCGHAQRSTINAAAAQHCGPIDRRETRHSRCDGRARADGRRRRSIPGAGDGFSLGCGTVLSGPPLAVALRGSAHKTFGHVSGKPQLALTLPAGTRTIDDTARFRPFTSSRSETRYIRAYFDTYLLEHAEASLAERRRLCRFSSRPHAAALRSTQADEPIEASSRENTEACSGTRNGATCRRGVLAARPWAPARPVCEARHRRGRRVSVGASMALARVTYAGHAKHPVRALSIPQPLYRVVRQNLLQAGILAPATAPPDAATSTS